MLELFSGISTKALIVFIGILLGALAALGIYSYFISSSLDKKKAEIIEKNLEIIELNGYFDLAIKTYENNLKIQSKVVEEKVTTKKEKEKVVIKYQTLIKEVEKRGEIKQDENNNFSIVNF